MSRDDIESTREEDDNQAVITVNSHLRRDP